MILLAMGTAGAQMIPHGHVVPESVRLFEKARMTTAEGKVKDGGCDAALAAAKADLDDRLKEGRDDTVIAIWPYKGRNTWEPSETVECFEKGKKTVVILEALIARPGQSAAYPEITGARTLEILAALFPAGGINVGFTVGFALEEIDGAVWINQPLAGETSSKPIRAGLVTPLSINQGMVPQLHRAAKKVKAVPEVAGIQLYQSVVDQSAEQKVHHGVWLRMPRGPLLQYHQGKLNERQLIARSTVLYEGPTDSDPQVVKVPPESIKLRK
jgi:hypothetical protein